MMEESEDIQNIVTEDNIIYHQPQRPLRYSESKKVLLIYSILCILLGLTVVACGIASIVVLPYFTSNQGFQVETKWMSITVLFTGISGMALLFNQQSVVFVTATLVLSTVSIPLSFAQLIVHSVNVHFRLIDLEKHRVDNNQKMINITSQVSTINTVLLITGLISCVVTLLIHRFTFQVVVRTYGYRTSMNKHRLRLAIGGLAQLILGLAISGWWAGIETIFKGENVNYYALPTGEILAHGIIISAGGYMQMMATSEGSQPVVFSCALLSGISVILATYFASYPISVFYLMLEKSQSDSSGGTFMELKVVFCIILAIIYIVTIVFSIYSFLKFSKLCNNDSLKDLRLSPPPVLNRALSSVTLVQPILGLVYAIIEILAVGLFYAYKLDFSSLPIMAIILGILLFVSLRSLHPLHLSGTIALAVLTLSLATRDIYLFIYHIVSKSTPDRSNTKEMTGGSLAVHCLQSLAAVFQVGFAIFIIVLVGKTLLQSISFIILRQSTGGTNRPLDRIMLWSGFLTGIFGVAMGVTGLLMFWKGASLYEVDFGDRSIFFGLSFIAISVISTFSKRKQVLMIPALTTHIVVLALVWQEADRLTYLVRRYSQNMEMNKDMATAPYKSQLSYYEYVNFGFSCCILLFLLAYSTMAYIFICGVGHRLANCRIIPSEDISLFANSLEDESAEMESMMDVREILNASEADNDVIHDSSSSAVLTENAANQN